LLAGKRTAEGVQVKDVKEIAGFTKDGGAADGSISSRPDRGERDKTEVVAAVAWLFRMVENLRVHEGRVNGLSGECFSGCATKHGCESKGQGGGKGR
jgi:hypothetical protein